MQRLIRGLLAELSRSWVKPRAKVAASEVVKQTPDATRVGKVPHSAPAVKTTPAAMKAARAAYTPKPPERPASNM